MLWGLSAIRAATARHHFQTLDFLAHGFVEDGVGQEDQPGRAGVGVSILASFAGAKYARLCDVHRAPSLWAGLRGVTAPAGPFLYRTLTVYPFWFPYATCFVSVCSPFMLEWKRKAM